jgi:hypothetical protein
MPDCSHLAGQLLGFVTSAALPICANKGPSAPSYSRTERTLRISPPIDLFRLSPVPVGPKICPYAREFRASLRRIADMPDSLAERSGFELPVPYRERALRQAPERGLGLGPVWRTRWPNQANIETFHPLAPRKPCDLTLVCQKRRGLNVPQREAGNRSVALHD